MKDSKRALHNEVHAKRILKGEKTWKEADINKNE